MRNVLMVNTYNGMALSKTHKNGQGFYGEILQSLDLLFEYMMKLHGRVFFTMFVLSYPAGSSHMYPDDNSLLLRFLDALMHHCKPKKHDPKYLWVRELSPKTGQIHYHLVLLLDYDHSRNAHVILQKANELWKKCLKVEDNNGLVELSKIYKNEYGYYGGGIQINRNDNNYRHVYEKCYELASYLAKRYSKEKLPLYVKRYDHSRIRRVNSI